MSIAQRKTPYKTLVEEGLLTLTKKVIVAVALAATASLIATLKVNKTKKQAKKKKKQWQWGPVGGVESCLQRDWTLGIFEKWKSQKKMKWKKGSKWWWPLGIRDQTHGDWRSHWMLPAGFKDYD